MSEPDHYNLYRKLRVAGKNDDDLFHIRYTLTDDRHAEETTDQHESENDRERGHKIGKPLPDAHRIGLGKYREKRKGSEEVKESSAKPKPKHRH